MVCFLTTSETGLSCFGAAAILLAAWLVPRGFCGYVCPLGTLIDLFDWSFSRRIRRFRVTRPGWWVSLKYYLLVAVLALGRVLLALHLHWFYPALYVGKEVINSLQGVFLWGLAGSLLDARQAKRPARKWRERAADLMSSEPGDVHPQVWLTVLAHPLPARPQ